MLLKFIKKLFTSKKDTLSVTEPFIITGNKFLKSTRQEQIKNLEKDILKCQKDSKEIPIQHLQKLYRLQRND